MESKLPQNVDYRPILQQMFGSRIVAYQVGLAKLLANPMAALLLSQFLYYDNADGHVPGSPFSRTETEIYEQTGLTAKMQRTARKALMEKQIVTSEKKGMPSRLWFKIDYRVLSALASGDAQMPLPSVLPDGKDLSSPMGSTSPPQQVSLVLPDGKDINTKNNKETKEKKRRSKRMANAPFAVEIVRLITHRSPNKQLWSMIENRVGEGRYLAWARVVKEWIASGYNPLNYKGMLNVLEKGWSKNGKQNSGTGHPSSASYDPEADVAKFKRQRGMQ